MASIKRILLFSDQTVDVYPAIRDLFRQSRHSLTLQTFLRSSTDALQIETAKLHTHERRRFQCFDSILCLAEPHVNGHLDVVISTVLLCVVQLGALIV